MRVHGSHCFSARPSRSVVISRSQAVRPPSSRGDLRLPTAPAAHGFVLTDEEEKRLHEGKGKIGLATNTVAGYESFLAGLPPAPGLGVRKLSVVCDSGTSEAEAGGRHGTRRDPRWAVPRRFSRLSPARCASA